MLQWFAQGLGKGQLCVGSASLTSHHLPTSIISVKEHLGGVGWGGGGDIEKARLPWSQLIPLRCWGCRSGYESWRGFYSARLISEPGGGPFQVERLGVCSVVKSPETCRVKARWTRMWACVCACVCVCVREEMGRGEAVWFPVLGSVKCFDLAKCFLQPWNYQRCKGVWLSDTCKCAHTYTHTKFTDAPNHVQQQVITFFPLFPLHHLPHLSLHSSFRVKCLFLSVRGTMDKNCQSCCWRRGHWVIQIKWVYPLRSMSEIITFLGHYILKCLDIWRKKTVRPEKRWNAELSSGDNEYWCQISCQPRKPGQLQVKEFTPLTNCKPSWQHGPLGVQSWYSKMKAIILAFNTTIKPNTFS